MEVLNIFRAKLAITMAKVANQAFTDHRYVTNIFLLIKMGFSVRLVIWDATRILNR
jgi:hypothetical protein